MVFYSNGQIYNQLTNIFMNIDENYRKLKKIENESIRLYLLKYSLINKLNNLHIKQHYYRTFSGLLFGNKFRKYVSMKFRINSS